MPTPPNHPTSDATRIFGERVLARRNGLGLSQEKAAEACGLHWTYLGQVERGRRNLTLHNILKIADGLEIDAGELVSGLPVPNDSPADTE
ncbi:helix-turn-helix domain-containing protein [Nocardia aurea]|uniref:Helix-turn-helix transcriptional regulator n=1 Tax=Nocardia aurea TaxID=2144174 RepID=A0ABV3FYA8_9NOCA